MREVITEGGYIVAERPISDEDRAKGEAIAAAERERQAAEAAETETIRQARPAAAIVQKLRDGTNLTAAELQAVVRFLALRALRGA